MRPIEIIGGAVLAVSIAALSASVSYAVLDGATRRDWSIIKSMQAGNLLAPVNDIFRPGPDNGRKSRALLAGIIGLALAGGAIALLARPNRSAKGASFLDRNGLREAGFLRSQTLFLGRYGGLSLAWKKKTIDPATNMPVWQDKRMLVGGVPVHAPNYGHVFVTGPTRSGKGASLIIPNALEFPGSMVILDIRGETFTQTAGWRSTFSKVFKFAPAQEHSHGYNPLDFIRRDPGFRENDIMNAATGLVASPGLKEEYWMKDARELVAGVISYVLESKNITKRSLRSVMDIINGSTYVIDRLKQILDDEGSELSTFTISKFNAFVNMGEKQFAGVFGELRGAMRAFANEFVLRATDSSSFNLFDFRKSPHTVYMDFRLSQLQIMTGIANVLLSQLINYLADEQPKPGDHKVILMLDEFTTLGKIEPLVASMKVAAGNGVSVWTFVQSLTDVKAIYDLAGQNSILDNSEAVVFLGGESPDVLDYLEKQMGKKIEIRQITRRSTGFGGASSSVEDREIETPLMGRDALRKLPREDALILPRSSSPIIVRRNYFWADTAMMKRAGLPAPKVPDLRLGMAPNVFESKPEIQIVRSNQFGQSAKPPEKTVQQDNSSGPVRWVMVRDAAPAIVPGAAFKAAAKPRLDLIEKAIPQTVAGNAATVQESESDFPAPAKELTSALAVHGIRALSPKPALKEHTAPNAKPTQRAVLNLNPLPMPASEFEIKLTPGRNVRPSDEVKPAPKKREFLKIQFQDPDKEADITAEFVLNYREITGAKPPEVVTDLIS